LDAGRHAIPGEDFPSSAPSLIETGDAMDGYRKVSVKAVFADELSERVIFWSLVSTSIIVSIAMLRGMLG
jgi:hypothetical protein